jgi:Polysaccharide pyruvyl transferase/Nucleotide-diphospho-sugar transferase
MKLALLTADVLNSMPNVGDYFITKAISELLSEHELTRVPLHRKPTESQLETLKKQDALVICGSNLVGAQGTVRCAFEESHFRFVGKPIIPLGLGAQADLGKNVQIDERGKSLLKYWVQSAGLLSVRDRFTQKTIDDLLGVGTTRLTGCPALSLRSPPFSTTEPRAVFCPGPYHYDVPDVERATFVHFTQTLHRRLACTRPTLFVAQQPTDLWYQPEPGTSTLCVPEFPEIHLKALVSAACQLSFRIHPLLVGITHGVPGLLIALDERTRSMAETTGIPFLAYGKSTRISEIEEAFQDALALFPWEEIRARISDLTLSLRRHLVEVGLNSSIDFAKSPQPPRSAPNLTIACISDFGYLPSCLGLLENLKEVGAGDLPVHLLALDEETLTYFSEQAAPLDVTVHSLETLWSPEEGEQVQSRTMAGKAYLAKPRFLEEVVKLTQGPVLFVDVDVYFFKSPESLRESLGTATGLLFPHWNDVLGHQRAHGIFNSGMMLMAPGSEGFLRWWSELCLYRCEENPKAGFYFEQGYLDFAPLYFPELQVYRGAPGSSHNVGPWNLKTLRVRRPVEEPWCPRAQGDEALGSFHAASPDALRLFEMKGAWDQMVAFFSMDALEANLRTYHQTVRQQAPYWPRLKRVYFLYETLKVRCRIGSLKLNPNWVRWAVRGWGSRPIGVASWCYSRMRDGKRSLRTQREAVTDETWIHLQQQALESREESWELLKPPAPFSVRQQIEKWKANDEDRGISVAAKPFEESGKLGV